jgi:hypothetical protein
VSEAVGVPMRVRELTPNQFGAWVEMPTRSTGGWLYAIRDEYNDGYPARTLGVIAGDDGSFYREEEFTDSDPHPYPKTLSDVVTVCEDQP